VHWALAWQAVGAGRPRHRHDHVRKAGKWRGRPHVPGGVGGALGASCGNALNFIPRISRDQRPTAAFGGTWLHISGYRTGYSNQSFPQVSDHFRN
jgi:hypothetical protein